MRFSEAVRHLEELGFIVDLPARERSRLRLTAPSLARAKPGVCYFKTSDFPVRKPKNVRGPKRFRPNRAVVVPVRVLKGRAADELLERIHESRAQVDGSLRKRRTT